MYIAIWNYGAEKAGLHGAHCLIIKWHPQLYILVAVIGKAKSYKIIFYPFGKYFLNSFKAISFRNTENSIQLFNVFSRYNFRIFNVKQKKYQLKRFQNLKCSHSDTQCSNNYTTSIAHRIKILYEERVSILRLCIFKPLHNI